MQRFVTGSTHAPARQPMPAHCGSPGPPHAAHWLLKHVRPVALQVSPAQQRSPSPPQSLH